MNSPTILIDSSILVGFYSITDDHHAAIKSFFGRCTSQLVTTVGCVTETMWLLRSDWRVQNDFLIDIAENIYQCEPLIASDFTRIAELNTQSQICLEILLICRWLPSLSG
jgi:predicted nucleic acid-binding protein